MLVVVALAAPPLWWSVGNPPVIDTNAAENNIAPANIGQAKYMVRSALDALEDILPSVATQIEQDLTIPQPNPAGGTFPAILDFTVPDPKDDTWIQKQKNPLLIGQLKAIADPFYTRLNEAAPAWLATERTTNGTSHPNSIFPWTTDTTDDVNKGVANIGQLKSVFSLRFETLTPDFIDEDYDGIDDNWELANGLDPSNRDDGYDDPDGDGIENRLEFVLGFDPNNDATNGTPDIEQDRDSDGISDWTELASGQWQWNSELQRYTYVRALDWEVPDANEDYDSDGLSNAAELQGGTDPADSDTDNDRLPDGWEVTHGLIATSPYGINGRAGDPDEDGVENQYEYILGLDPNNETTDSTFDIAKDRDGDGMPDWWEASMVSWQWDSEFGGYSFTKALDWEVADQNEDPDSDGLSNVAEFDADTDPFDSDTDNDYLPDGWEVTHGLVTTSSSGANGRYGDPDGDGIENQYEYVLGFDPNNASTNATPDIERDRDGDGMLDWREASTVTWLYDYELGAYSYTKALDWEVADANEDPDSDGLTNIAELDAGTDPFDYDTDNDRLPDGWEVSHQLDPTSSSGVDGKDGDLDGDGISNQHEFVLGFDPGSASTDGTLDAQRDRDMDGMTDVFEVRSGSFVYDYDSELFHFARSLDWEQDQGLDADADGISNVDEVSVYFTDPTNADTDSDSLPDGWEIDNGYDPTDSSDRYSDQDEDKLGVHLEYGQGSSDNNHDTDGDGWSDYHEYHAGTDPTLSDSDSDGVGDYDEDTDSDGLTNRQEIATHLTNPLVADTDGDGLEDGFEVLNSSQFDPLKQDSYVDEDADGLLSAEELLAGTSQTNPDTDFDGLQDGIEVSLGYNPLLADSDNDGMRDEDEDFDGDGLSNKTELENATDIFSVDTDGDGEPDNLDQDPRGDGYLGQ